MTIGSSGIPNTWSQRHGATPSRLAATSRPSTEPSMLWRNPGWLALGSIIVLSVLGLMAIHLTEDPDSPRFFLRQLVFFIIAITSAIVVAFPHPRFWQWLSYPGAVAVTLLLIFLLIPFVPDWIVHPRNGARRWINLQFMDMQPSELAKIAIVLALANYLRVRENYRTLVGLVPPFAIMLFPAGLILIEPDLGTTMLFPVALMAMLTAAGAKLWHLFSVAGAGLATCLLIAVVSLTAASQDPPQYPLLEEHQVERIQGLINQVKGDTRHKDTINYQLSKSLTLVGSGGFSGLGEERSRVIIAYNRLPFDHNDMIFAVVANRWGFIGGSLIIVLYLIMAGSCLTVAAVTHDPFGRLVCVGFCAILMSQVFINIGMTIGLLPITGMTLPFISYGGSSLVANFIMIGMVLGIGLRPDRSFIMKRSFEFDSKRPDVDPLSRLR